MSYFCDVCNLSYNTKASFEEHKWSQLHHNTLEVKQNLQSHQCMLCNDRESYTLKEYQLHLVGRVHKEKYLQWLRENKNKGGERQNETRSIKGAKQPKDTLEDRIRVIPIRTQNGGPFRDGFQSSFYEDRNSPSFPHTGQNASYFYSIRESEYGHLSESKMDSSCNEKSYFHQDSFLRRREICKYKSNKWFHKGRSSYRQQSEWEFVKQTNRAEMDAKFPDDSIYTEKQKYFPAYGPRKQPAKGKKWKNYQKMSKKQKWQQRQEIDVPKNTKKSNDPSHYDHRDSKRRHVDKHSKVKFNEEPDAGLCASNPQKEMTIEEANEILSSSSQVKKDGTRIVEVKADKRSAGKYPDTSAASEEVVTRKSKERMNSREDIERDLTCKRVAKQVGERQMPCSEVSWTDTKKQSKIGNKLPCMEIDLTNAFEDSHSRNNTLSSTDSRNTGSKKEVYGQHSKTSITTAGKNLESSPHCSSREDGERDLTSKRVAKQVGEQQMPCSEVSCTDTKKQSKIGNKLPCMEIDLTNAFEDSHSRNNTLSSTDSRNTGSKKEVYGQHSKTSITTAGKSLKSSPQNFDVNKQNNSPLEIDLTNSFEDTHSRNKRSLDADSSSGDSKIVASVQHSKTMVNSADKNLEMQQSNILRVPLSGSRTSYRRLDVNKFKNTKSFNSASASSNSQTRQTHHKPTDRSLNEGASKIKRSDDEDLKQVSFDEVKNMSLPKSQVKTGDELRYEERNEEVSEDKNCEGLVSGGIKHSNEQCDNSITTSSLIAPIERGEEKGKKSKTFPVQSKDSRPSSTVTTSSKAQRTDTRDILSAALQNSHKNGKETVNMSLHIAENAESQSEFTTTDNSNEGSLTSCTGNNNQMRKPQLEEAAKSTGVRDNTLKSQLRPSSEVMVRKDSMSSATSHQHTSKESDIDELQKNIQKLLHNAGAKPNLAVARSKSTSKNQMHSSMSGLKNKLLAVLSSPQSKKSRSAVEFHIHKFFTKFQHSQERFRKYGINLNPTETRAADADDQNLEKFLEDLTNEDLDLLQSEENSDQFLQELYSILDAGERVCKPTNSTGHIEVLPSVFQEKSTYPQIGQNEAHPISIQMQPLQTSDRELPSHIIGGNISVMSLTDSMSRGRSVSSQQSNVLSASRGSTVQTQNVAQQLPHSSHSTGDHEVLPSIKKESPSPQNESYPSSRQIQQPETSCGSHIPVVPCTERMLQGSAVPCQGSDLPSSSRESAVQTQDVAQQLPPSSQSSCNPVNQSVLQMMWDVTQQEEERAEELRRLESSISEVQRIIDAEKAKLELLQKRKVEVEVIKQQLKEQKQRLLRGGNPEDIPRERQQFYAQQSPIVVSQIPLNLVFPSSMGSIHGPKVSIIPLSNLPMNSVPTVNQGPFPVQCDNQVYSQDKVESKPDIDKTSIASTSDSQSHSLSVSQPESSERIVAETTKEKKQNSGNVPLRKDFAGAENDVRISKDANNVDEVSTLTMESQNSLKSNMMQSELSSSQAQVPSSNFKRKLSDHVDGSAEDDWSQKAKCSRSLSHDEALCIKKTSLDMSSSLKMKDVSINLKPFDPENVSGYLKGLLGSGLSMNDNHEAPVQLSQDVNHKPLVQPSQNVSDNHEITMQSSKGNQVREIIGRASLMQRSQDVSQPLTSQDISDNHETPMQSSKGNQEREVIGEASLMQRGPDVSQQSPSSKPLLDKAVSQLMGTGFPDEMVKPCDSTLEATPQMVRNGVSVLMGHSAPVLRLIGHSDFIISSSMDFTARCWNFKLLSCFKVFEGHHKKVDSLCVHWEPRSKNPVIFTGSSDKRLHCYKMQTSELLHDERFITPVTCMERTLDGKYILLGMNNGTIHYYNPQVLAIEKSYDCGKNESITCMKSTVVDEEMSLAIGTSGGCILIYAQTCFKKKQALFGHESAVLCLEVFKGHALSGSENQLLQHNMETGETVRCFEGYHEKEITSICGLFKGSFYTSSGNLIREFDFKTGKLQRIIHCTGQNIMCLLLYCEKLFAGITDGSILMIEMKTSYKHICKWPGCICESPSTQDMVMHMMMTHSKEPKCLCGDCHFALNRIAKDARIDKARHFLSHIKKRSGKSKTSEEHGYT